MKREKISKPFNRGKLNPKMATTQLVPLLQSHPTKKNKSQLWEIFSPPSIDIQIKHSSPRLCKLEIGHPEAGIGPIWERIVKSGMQRQQQHPLSENPFPGRRNLIFRLVHSLIIARSRWLISTHSLAMLWSTNNWKLAIPLFGRLATGRPNGPRRRQVWRVLRFVSLHEYVSLQ